MKTTLLCALLALSMFCVHRWELAAVRGDLNASREDARLTAERRVPKAELARAQSAAAAVERKAADLEQALAATREQLAASQQAAKAAEQRLAAAAPAAGEPVGPVAPPGLVKGSFTLQDDTRIYSPDAQLQVGKSVLISSPTGLMLSDQEVAMVAGDLAVETPSGKMQAVHAFIDINDGKIEMNADSMTFTNK